MPLGLLGATLGKSDTQPSRERKQAAGKGKDKTEALHPAWAYRSGR